MIILQPTEADQVRGLTVRGHALAPRPLADGTFALPEAVLTDPYHAVRKAFLSTLDLRLDSTINPADWEQDPVKTAPNAYKSTWVAGQLVTVP
jgi:hypothetical protein